MKIFIDFDDVLFNTRQFKNDYFLIFERNGIARKVFDECYYNEKEQLENIKKYNPANHIQRVCEREQIDAEKITLDVAEFVSDTKKYVFPDVMELVRNFKKEDLFIISFSLTNFQQAKIFNSGIANCFKKVEIVNELKSTALEKIIQEEKISEDESIYFIDDRVEQIENVKNRYSKCQTILIKRPEGRYQDEKSHLCDYEAENLKEVFEIIKNSPC